MITLGPAFWWVLGSSGVLLTLLGLLQIGMFFIAPHPAMREVEIESGMEMPNRRWMFLFLFGVPILCVVVGIEALLASVVMLNLK